MLLQGIKEDSMEYNVVINGFHGTNEQSAKDILDSKHFTPKVNEKHWLGQGVYFFKDDPDQAMSWAMEITRSNNRRNNKNQDATVLITEINVKNNFFLDLNSRTGLYRLKNILINLNEALKELGIGLGKENLSNNDFSHRYRCAVLDLIPKDKIKVIQKNFPLQKQPSFTNNIHFNNMNLQMHSIQVCVRDEGVISKEKIKFYKKKSMKDLGVRRTFRKKKEYNFNIKHLEGSDFHENKNH